MALTTKFSKINNTNQAITSAAIAFSGAAAYSFSFSSRNNLPLTGNSFSVAPSTIAGSFSNQLYAVSTASSLLSSSSYIVYTVPSGRNAKVFINPGLIFSQIGSISVYNSETLTAQTFSTSAATILITNVTTTLSGGSIFLSGALVEYNSQNVYHSAQYTISVNNYPVITSSFVNRYNSENMTLLATAPFDSAQNGAGGTVVTSVTLTPPNAASLTTSALTSLSNLAALGYTNMSSLSILPIYSLYLGAGDSIVISYAAQASVDTLYAMEVGVSYSALFVGGSAAFAPLTTRLSTVAGVSTAPSVWWQSRSVSYGITASQFLDINAGLIVIEEPAS